MFTVSDGVGRQRFVKGVLLAWLPFFLLIIPAIVELVNSFGQSKATGMGAVAGGLAEFFVMFGIVAFFVSQVLAIILLSRSFEKGHGARSLFSVVSICCSALLLAIGGLATWMMTQSR